MSGIGAEGRVAFYYAPEGDDPLAEAAAVWLGRDAVGGARVQPELPDVAAITAEARGYGFHATLKPPMRLRDGVGWGEVLQVAAGIAAAVPAFDMPPLRVADLHGFLALREAEPSPELQAFADACVAGADHLRAPASEGELARRRKGGALPGAQEANLVRWGYPYVFATWFFHMTLTRRLDAAERAVFMPAAEQHFAAALGVTRRVESLCLFTQAGPGAGFVLAERVALRG